MQPKSERTRDEATKGLARVRAWIGRPLGRALLVLSGLVVLSLVGRFAAAGGGQGAPVASGGASSLIPPPITSVGVPPVVVVPPPLAVIDAAPPQTHHASSASEDDPVYLNEATIDDLRRLPGVGEKRGMAILDQRRKQGHFRQVEDLLHVKGIGRSTLRRLRPLVRLDHPTPEGGAP
jgi:competence protein ComEA